MNDKEGPMTQAIRKRTGPQEIEIRVAPQGREIVIGRLEERASDTGRKIFRCVRYLRAATRGTPPAEKLLGSRASLDDAERLIVESWEKTSRMAG